MNPRLASPCPGVISALNRDIRSQLGTTIPGGIQTGECLLSGSSTPSCIRTFVCHICAVTIRPSGSYSTQFIFTFSPGPLPTRCCHQPGQQRRSPAGLSGPSCWYQHRHLHTHRQFSRCRLRHSRRHGTAGVVLGSTVMKACSATLSCLGVIYDNNCGMLRGHGPFG